MDTGGLLTAATVHRLRMAGFDGKWLAMVSKGLSFRLDSRHELPVV